MWWLLPVIAIAGAWYSAISLGFVPPPNAKIIIKIHHGKIRVTGGQLRAQSGEFVTDILQQVNISTGFIAITHSERVAFFSRNIPQDVRQRLRNVLLNDPF